MRDSKRAWEDWGTCWRPVPKWLGENGQFSVKSQYNLLFETDTEDRNKKLWKAKIPLKIKIFMWLVKQNTILTRDNLSRKGWQGDKTCSFCNAPENVEHLSLSVPCLDIAGVWFRLWLELIVGLPPLHNSECGLLSSCLFTRNFIWSI